MITKIKDNLALVVTGITLLGSVGAGFQAVTNIVNTLTGIDSRMINIETEFNKLKQDTMVSNDIAVLYEKIATIESQSQQFDYIVSQIGYYDSEINNLKQRIDSLEWAVQDLENKFNGDDGFFDSQEYSLQKWEWLDLQKKITTLENNQLESWELDSLKDRLAYLEAYMHQH